MKQAILFTALFLAGGYAFAADDSIEQLTVTFRKCVSAPTGAHQDCFAYGTDPAPDPVPGGLSVMPGEVDLLFDYSSFWYEGPVPEFNKLYLNINGCAYRGEHVKDRTFRMKSFVAFRALFNQGDSVHGRESLCYSDAGTYHFLFTKNDAKMDAVDAAGDNLPVWCAQEFMPGLPYIVGEECAIRELAGLTQVNPESYAALAAHLL